ncbi:MAG TPA: plastocyanin/azurin family copper-binding protein [Ktedonobacteraceae bacterium]
MKNFLITLLLLSALSTVLFACGGNGGNVAIHTSAMSFAQSSVTLKSGQSLVLINDASDTHMIDLGTWQKGVAQNEQEPGAPQIDNAQLSGNGSLTLGPWKTPGTYQIYCPMHPNMNLTVVVQ